MTRPATRFDSRDPDRGSTALLALARRAAERAHAPYSSFPVGAAVRDLAGQVFTGCNVESPTYGLSICAERLAIFTAIAAGARLPLVALAVACTAADPELGSAGRMPCGICRQAMAEHLAPDAPIYVDGVGVRTLEDLLPESFMLARARLLAVLDRPTPPDSSPDAD